jgi:hypothetical protein
MLSALLHMQNAKFLTGLVPVHYAFLRPACWNTHGVYLGPQVQWILLWVYTAIYLCMILQSFLELDRFLSFLLLYKVCMSPWTGDQPVGRPLPTHGTTRTQNKHRELSMP